MEREKLVIDLGFASSAQSLHEILAASLGFPDYYGMNWDAFDECIRHPEGFTLPKELVFKNIKLIEDKLPREAKLLKQILVEFIVDRPDLKITYS